MKLMKAENVSFCNEIVTQKIDVGWKQGTNNVSETQQTHFRNQTTRLLSSSSSHRYKMFLFLILIS